MRCAEKAEKSDEANSTRRTTDDGQASRRDATLAFAAEARPAATAYCCTSIAEDQGPLYRPADCRIALSA